MRYADLHVIPHRCWANDTVSGGCLAANAVKFELQTCLVLCKLGGSAVSLAFLTIHVCVGDCHDLIGADATALIQSSTDTRADVVFLTVEVHWQRNERAQALTELREF